MEQICPIWESEAEKLSPKTVRWTPALDGGIMDHGEPDSKDPAEEEEDQLLADAFLTDGWRL